MSPFLRFPIRSVMTSVSVIACVAILLCPPGTALAQSANGADGSNGSTGPGGQGTSDKTTTDKTTTDKNAPVRSARPRPYVPPPGNPLVKINPNDGSGNDTRDYNKDGTRKQPRRWMPADYGDYQADADDPRLGQRPKSLPIFGYDTFAWPRQYRSAQRAGLMRKYPGLFADEDQQTTRKRTKRNVNGANGNSTQDKTTSKRSRGINSDDETDTTGRPRKQAQGATGADDNTDNGAITNRSTRSTDDDTTDDTPVRPRRTRNTDDNTDDTDNTDNADVQAGTNGSQSGGGVYRGTRNSDGSDNADEMSTDDEIRQQDLQIENERRRQLGLPPRTDDSMDQDGARSATGRSNSTGNSRTGRSTLNGRNGVNSLDNGYSSPRNGNSDAAGNRDDSLEPIDAYSQVADPLSQLTRNITASPPPNYQLSGGDKVVIRYSNPAMAQREVTRTVDSQGNLTLDEVGHINVAGLSLDQVQQTILKRLQRLYKKPEVTVTLKELRTIAVTVAGKAFLTGTYNVPASATAFNVLYVAGGPTKEGSMRSIEIRRQNKTLTFDLYKTIMVSAPQKSSSVPNYQPDIPLQSGDVIYVPTYHQRVAVEGEVREPALFELKEGETLEDVLSYAGGIKGTGVSKHVQVNTIDPGSARVIKDIDVQDVAKARTVALYDGDVVNVLALRPIIANKVTIDGAVQQPSDYALTPNMRVADLVRAANNPLSDAYLGHAALYRWNPNGTYTLIPINLAKALDGEPEDNQPLMKWDRLEIYSRQEAFFTGNHKVIVRGAVQRIGAYSYADNMRVSDLFFKVGGPLPDAEMVVVEHQHGDGTKQYETAPVADIVHGNQAKNIKIEDNDIVSIYRNGETGFIPDHTVMIEGFVQAPGLYDRGEGMKLSDLVKLAGDFKPDAGQKVVVVHARRPVDGPDADFRTVAVLFDSQHHCAAQDDVRLQDGDRVLIQGKGGFEDRPAVVNIGGAVNKPGPYPVTSKKMRLSDLIAQAGGLRKEAFPQGAQFKRDPKLLASDEQRQMARIISDFSDLNNASAYKREVALSDLARIQASGAATQGSVLTGGGSQPNPAAAALATELSRHSTVTPARNLSSNDLEPTGNIAVNLPGAMQKPGGPDDILLLDGDNVFIPVTPTTVYVEGGVVNPRGVLFKQGETLSYYISQAGGYAPDAAKDRIVVIHAGGGLTPGNQVRTLQVGDMIIVPLRVMAEKLPNPNSGVNGFFSQVLGGALIFRLLGL